jgi:hypothetical protein
MTSISRLEAHGIPVTASKGGLVETTTVVHSVDQLRSLLDLGLDEKGRQEHYDALFSGIEAAVPGTGDDGGAGMAQRITSHVIGNRELSTAEKAEIAPAFPLTVHVAAAAGPLTISSEYDLSTTDGSLRIASFTDVIMEQGGYFLCQSTPLVFTCNTLTRTGGSGSGLADFVITGRTGVKPPTPAPQGAGTQAATGSNGNCSSAGIASAAGGPGNPGAPGTAGRPGTPGNAGTPCMQATITISQTLTSDNPITIYSQSGAGGPGGDGGTGGAGQRGGNGGSGVTCGCTGSAGGQGGDGGPGGVGGAAGNGGNGADAGGNIAVKVPQLSDVDRVTIVTAPAPGGLPGASGLGGSGGEGGSGGGGGKNNGSGGSGGSGAPGVSGGQGQPGTGSNKVAGYSVKPV